MIELILTVLFITVLAILAISMWSMAVRVEELAATLRKVERGVDCLNPYQQQKEPSDAQYWANTFAERHKGVLSD
jgi:hypothetical protein